MGHDVDSVETFAVRQGRDHLLRNRSQAVQNDRFNAGAQVVENNRNINNRRINEYDFRYTAADVKRDSLCGAEKIGSILRVCHRNPPYSQVPIPDLLPCL
jgi:hypothetical protein